MEEVEGAEAGHPEQEGPMGAEAGPPRRRSTRSNPGVLVAGLEPAARPRRTEAAAVPAAPLNTPVSKSNVCNRVG